MSGDAEFRCFVGGLSWSTSDRDLKVAFEKFGHLLEAKVVLDKASGRSRGFGFVTFDEKQAMEEAIDAMNGLELDGRSINVDRAKPQQASGGRDYDNDRSRDRDRHDRGREYGGGRGTGDGGCFNCGKSGHFARECPSEGARGGRDGGREDRYGGGRDGGREDRYGGGRDGGREDRYGGGGDGGREDRYGGGGGGGRYGPDRGGDRYGGRSRDNGGREGSDRYSRDRSGPYDRR